MHAHTYIDRYRERQSQTETDTDTQRQRQKNTQIETDTERLTENTARRSNVLHVGYRLQVV